LSALGARPVRRTHGAPPDQRIQGLPPVGKDDDRQQVNSCCHFGTTKSMSLAPAERKALARIEDSLCRSDPELAAMLARFSLPGPRLSFPGLRRLLSGASVSRRWPRLRRFMLVPAVGFLAVLAAVIAVLLSPTAQSACGARTEGFAVVQVSACKPASGAPTKAPHPAAKDRHLSGK
jgi:hypothetical protein